MLEKFQLNHEAISSREIATVRILPLQMNSPETIRTNLQRQRQHGEIEPWDIRLTFTTLLLNGPHAPTPNSVSLIGGTVKTPSPGAALGKLAQEAHAYGIPDKSLSLVKTRAPYTLISQGGIVRCLETIYATEVTPSFHPRAIGSSSQHHEFMRASPKFMKKIILDEKVVLDDERKFRLIGNLRAQERARRQDQFLTAGNADVTSTRNAILTTLNQYEAEIRRAVALQLLKTAPYENFNPPDSWREFWGKQLTRNPLSNNKSITAFSQTYHKFLEDYAKNITGVRTPKLWLARDFARACDHVYLGKTKESNSLIPTQGDYLAEKDFKPREFIRLAKSAEIFAGGPEYYVKLIRFAFEAFAATSGKDLFSKLLQYRKFLISQRSIPAGRPLTEDEEKTIIEYEAQRRKIYETYARYFISTYSVCAGDEDQRLELWQNIYAEHSKLNDDFFAELANESAVALASHPRYPLALNQLADVMVDQLDEHLLGSFNINMYSVGPVLLSEHEGYEFRRKLLGTTLFLTDVKPEYVRQIAESTYFLRDIIKHMQIPGTKTERYLLVVAHKSHTPTLIPSDADPRAIRDRVIDSYTGVQVEIEGVRYRLIYPFRTKNILHMYRKAIERGRRASQIFDVTGFSLVIDDSTVAKEFTSEKEKREFYNALIYKLEQRIETIAKECGYHYSLLTDEEHKRKDKLSGEEAFGGSAASRPLRALKEYPVLKIINPLRPRSQTQEVQLMDLSGYWEKLQDDTRYARDRLRESKWAKVTTGDGQEVQMMLYPPLGVIFPPDIESYQGSYIDLMVGKKPLPPRSWWQRQLARLNDLVAQSQEETPPGKFTS